MHSEEEVIDPNQRQIDIGPPDRLDDDIDFLEQKEDQRDRIPVVQESEEPHLRACRGEGQQGDDYTEADV